MSKHSPSPWEFLEAHSHNDEWSASRPLTICSADNEDVANVFSPNDSTVSITRETAIANARLIAAAPDLLQLVFQYRDDLHHPPSPDSRERRLAAIEAAIADAEGR